MAPSHNRNRDAQVEDGVSLLAHLIHDLKNPLGVVIGYAETIPLAEPEEQPALCARLTVNARVMLEVLDEYALLEALRQDRVPLERGLHEWRIVTDRVLQDVAEAAAEREQHVSCRADDAVKLHGDAQRIRQVLRLLVREALRSTPKGASLELAAEPVEGAVELVVAVSAEGVDGVPAMLRIFDADRPAIALARRLMTLHGGTLSFEVLPGRTAARARLPLGPGLRRRPGTNPIGHE